jgi:hypothetical protein
LSVASCGIVPNAFDQTQQVVNIDAVGDSWLGGLGFGKHDKSPLRVSFWVDWSVASAA